MCSLSTNNTLHLHGMLLFCFVNAVLGLVFSHFDRGKKNMVKHHILSWMLWHEGPAWAIFRKPSRDFCCTKYCAPVYLFIYIFFWLSGGIEVVLQVSDTGLSLCPVHDAFRCCSTALLSGRRQYCMCLIREWEDLNPPGLGPAELKIAREDLKIRLPCLCNAHSSASL